MHTLQQHQVQAHAQARSCTPSVLTISRRSPIVACLTSSSAPPASTPTPSLLRQAQLLTRVASSWYSQQQLPAPTSPQGLREQMASAGRSCMAVLPWAATTLVGGGTGAGMGDIFDALSKAIDIFLFLLTVRVLLSWFRNINWLGEPFRTLRSFTDPALNACRGIIPPIGGMDLSPMLLFFGLNFAAKQLKIMALSA